MKQIDASSMVEKLRGFLLHLGLPAKFANLVADFSQIIIILAVTILVYYILKFFINRFLKRLVLRSTSKWDDYLYEERVFTRLAMIIPALILEVSLSGAAIDHPYAVRVIDLVLKLYILGIITLVINSFLNAVYRIYGEFDVAGSKPIKGYVQIAKITVYVVVGIIAISALIGQSPLSILAGLGAISAVLILVFKDTLLGFVAGLQISSNKMLMIGDWITIPKHNADGTVFDISLVTVKIRNFDNSVSLVPTYTLITESFQNWRSMMDAGGRRLKRSVLLDIESICFIDEKFAGRLKTYGIGLEMNNPGQRRETNLGVFRRYIQEFIKNSDKVNRDMTILVRQLQPTENGLPLEFYCYSNAATLGEFESFQSGLFEHIFAVLPGFGLKIFQRRLPVAKEGRENPDFS